MTREERIKQGWKENWGRFDWSDETWHTADGWHKPARRRVRYESFGGAMAGLCIGLDAGAQVVPRRFWTRKRPKPKPELRVGDEVLVRCRVGAVNQEHGSGCTGCLILVPLPAGSHFYIMPEHVVRAKE